VPAEEIAGKGRKNLFSEKTAKKHEFFLLSALDSAP
jgi:hypothetical protein